MCYYKSTLLMFLGRSEVPLGGESTRVNAATPNYRYKRSGFVTSSVDARSVNSAQASKGFCNFIFVLVIQAAPR